MFPVASFSCGLVYLANAGNVHALTSAYYLTRVLAEIQECVNEVVSMDISPDASSGMKGLLESARWRFEGALTNVWLRGKLN